MNCIFDTPILFLIFNRPNTTKRVFEQIRMIRPKQLFIAADGPRTTIPDERMLCEETREIIKDINWDCEVKTLFRDENLGCGKAISSAITWFFYQVKYGIILEDDCLPSEDFFTFCRLMLIQHEQNKHIMQINGFNPYGGNKRSNLYFKTIYPKIWGWATWQDRWQKNSFELSQWDQFMANKRFYLSRFGVIEGLIRYFVWKRIRSNIERNNDATTWDYQWNFAIMMSRGYCIEPSVNMVKNIGMDSGVHYSGSKFAYKNMDYGILSEPLLFKKSWFNLFDFKVRIHFLWGRVVNRL